eukprot:RCo026562
MADVNEAVSTTKTTPLHIVSAQGHRNVAELLLERKAEVDCEDSLGHSPLYRACLYGHAGTAQLLVEHKADLGQGFYNGRVGDGGDCPLFVSCRLGHADVVESLADELSAEAFGALGGDALLQCVRGASFVRAVTAENDMDRREGRICDVCSMEGIAYSNHQDDYDVCTSCYCKGYCTYADI